MNRFSNNKSSLTLRSLLGVCFVSSIVSACGNDNVTACTDVALFGVTVVVPGGSALSRLGRSISGTLTSGTYSESLNVWANASGDGPAQLSGAMERTGEYSLLLRVTGYQDFKQDNIVVKKTRDGCHVQVATVTATLTPIQ